MSYAKIVDEMQRSLTCNRIMQNQNHVGTTMVTIAIILTTVMTTIEIEI